MRKALLIGFEYNGKKKLPGIATDLYQVYCFLKKHGWNDDEISIMTDITKDDITENLKGSILENIVNSDVLSFIGDCKERNQYTLFKSHNHYNNFSSIFPSQNNLFVYYTGHCKDGNIILPNDSLIALDLFREYLNKSKKIICVMDCCEGGIELPFILNGKIYRCKEQLTKNMFINSEMICLSSSLENENSVTSKSGSYFTRYLFNILNNEHDLTIILEKMKKTLSKIKQTANISTSYPKLSYVPGFLYSRFININVYSTHIVCEL